MEGAPAAGAPAIGALEVGAVEFEGLVLAPEGAGAGDADGIAEDDELDVDSGLTEGEALA
jgi:hypothetical protein